MSQFTSVREAKEFLVKRIVEEAQREGISFSQLEEQMLYFSETGWTLPNILEVSDSFDRDYDQAEYEEKIAGLIKGFVSYARLNNSADLKSWNDAVRRLREEDHYLLVMVGLAEGSMAALESRPLNHQEPFLRLLVFVVVGFIACFVCVMAYLILRSR